MSKYRQAARRDANQPEIVAKCRAWGYGVKLGCDDIIVAKDGINLIVEIKMPGKEKQLTPSEQKMLDTWPGAYLVASSFEDIHGWFIARGEQ